MGKRASGLLGALALSLCVVATSFEAKADVPKYVFDNLSKCATNADFSPACRWFDGTFGDWTEAQKKVVSDSLNEAKSFPKAQQFFTLIQNLGLKEVHFINIDDGIDQAATTVDNQIAYISLHPAFYQSGVKFKGVSTQQHVLLHELFHVWAYFSAGGDLFGDPFWRGLSDSIEWTYSEGHTSMVDSAKLNAALKLYDPLMHSRQWDAATKIDMDFSRPLGFPSFYSMTKITEYLPELGSFLIHDPDMQNEIPTPVVQFLRSSTTLGFLIDPNVSTQPGALGPRAFDSSKQNEFVGMLFTEDVFMCTVFLLKNGVAATAKHCIDSSWAPNRSFNGETHYEFLSLVFVKADGTRVRVDGSNITGVHRDSGINDLAFINYDADKTAGQVQIPTLHFVRDPNAFKDRVTALFNIGFPLPTKVQRLTRTVSLNCHLDGQFAAMPDPQFQGMFFGTGCPAWFGSSGSPVVSTREGEPGHYNLYGVLSHTFDTDAKGQPVGVLNDAWGPYTSSNFSPVYLGKEFLELEGGVGDG